MKKLPILQTKLPTSSKNEIEKIYNLGQEMRTEEEEINFSLVFGDGEIILGWNF